VSPVRYELEFYVPEDDILHTHRRENLESYFQTLTLARDLNQGTRTYGAEIALTALRHVHHTSPHLRQHPILCHGAAQS
jgi:hypothetical protein